MKLEKRISDPKCWSDNCRLDPSLLKADRWTSLPSGVIWDDVYIYDLFINGTHIGKASCYYRQTNVKNGIEDWWHLNHIEIKEGFTGKGYGSLLLEDTCKILWNLKKLPIKLESPSDQPDAQGLNRYQWYKRHEFNGPPLSQMIRNPPS